MEEEDQRALQLFLPTSVCLRSDTKKSSIENDASNHPLVDLNLSMGFSGLDSSDEESNLYTKRKKELHQQAAEQIRVATAENAFAERMRELTRRELELAERDFARARAIWERAKEEMAKVERMKEIATKRINSTCLEITCHNCHQRFRP
ncbi:protein indeterminate-domain 16-like [Zingiber officinale]|uniref:protein indeterminate-domain 16-like n=1 Tax=Zingiber officinale TaxID=94328 RepID=UPI001C4BE1AC|nr:protein indeterminate-domain 16-like [Zingiber officinale]